MTLVNTRYRKPPRSPQGWRTERQPFDARGILSEHSDLDFGVHELPEMHLSQRLLEPGQYYRALDVIDV